MDGYVWLDMFLIDVLHTPRAMVSLTSKKVGGVVRMLLGFLMKDTHPPMSERLYICMDAFQIPGDDLLPSPWVHIN